MPTRKKKPKSTDLQYNAEKSVGKERSTNYGVTFVNLHLLTDDKQKLSELAEQPFDIAEFIDGWVCNGYKFSLGEDRNGTAFTAAITGKTCIEENVGYCLTAKHAYPDMAVLCLYYKHHYLCHDGVFPSKEEAKRTAGDWE